MAQHYRFMTCKFCHKQEYSSNIELIEKGWRYVAKEKDGEAIWRACPKCVRALTKKPPITNPYSGRKSWL